MYFGYRTMVDVYIINITQHRKRLLDYFVEIREGKRDLTHPTDETLHSITMSNKGNKSSEADFFRNIKVKHHTHLKMAI
jgi:hypothetical protein